MVIRRSGNRPAWKVRTAAGIQTYAGLRSRE